MITRINPNSSFLFFFSFSLLFDGARRKGNGINMLQQKGEGNSFDHLLTKRRGASGRGEEKQVGEIFT